MSVQAITAVRGGAEPFRAGTAAAAAQPAAPPTQPAREAQPVQEARAEEARSTARAATKPADPPPDAQAAFATSQYLVGLLAVQQTGGASSQLLRPAHITPERLSALVEFLESHVPHRPAGTGRTPVDTSA